MVFCRRVDLAAGAAAVVLENLHHLVARDDQHGIANVHDDLVGLLREDFAGNRGLIFQLDGVGPRGGQAARNQS